jgi:hypothetical protein
LWNEERRIEFEFDGAKLVARDTRTVLQEPVPGGGCEVVARDAGGNVAVARRRLGKGKILVVNFALEKFVAESAPNAVDGDFTNELWRIYAWVAREAGVRRLVSKSDPRLVLTEHPALGERPSRPFRTGETPVPPTLVCALNTRPEEAEFAIDVAGRVGRVWNGAFENGRLRVGGNDGAVFEVLWREQP